MTALDLIKSTYDNRNRESLILIVNDEFAKRVLAAWTLYNPSFNDFPVRQSDNPIIVLDRLWTNTMKNVDMERLALIAGVPSTRTSKIFERLRAARLIYPDGTATELALVTVRAEVTANLQVLAPAARRTYVPGYNQGPDAPRQGIHQPNIEGVPGGQPAERGADTLRRGKASRSGGKAR